MKGATFRRGSMVRLTAACLAPAIALSWLTLAGAEPQVKEAPTAPTEPETKNRSLSVNDICRTLARAAAENEIPEEFFTRLIWQESRFDPAAVSPAGAQGIAQFMPGTAAARGLVNAFEPLQALQESASYLRELRTTFRGSLGLAAAAYNAGPGQVEAWLAGRSGLPFETQAYVRIITGYAAQEWASRTPPQLAYSNTETGERCLELAKLMIAAPRRRRDLAADPAWGPWGVQLAGTWSEGRVLATYEQLRRKYNMILGDRLPLVVEAYRRAPSRFIVRVSESSRPAADSLCSKLRAAGGACVVLRNPRH